MKGKIFNLKLILVLLVLLMAGVCFCVASLPSGVDQLGVYSTKVTLKNADGEDEDYSAHFNEGNIIFSAEKVLVNSVKEDIKLDDDSQVTVPTQKNNSDRIFLTNYGDKNIYTGGAALFDATKSSLYTFNGEKYEKVNPASSYDENKTYYTLAEQFSFDNLADGEKNKTVIENGKFVRLDNTYNGSDFISPKTPGGEEMQEAVMLSLGLYVYNGDKVQIANGKTDDSMISSKITRLSVEISKDGKPYEVSTLRRANGIYLDFCCLIMQKQDSSNEGYYEISFTYLTEGGIETGGSFAFYIINQDSYTQSIDPSGKFYGYSAKPVMGWTNDGNTQFDQTTLTNGYVRYYIGKTGIGSENIAYPTITFDYIKYSLSYTHTANDVKTQNVLSYYITGENSAKMTISSSSIAGNNSQSFEIDYNEDSATNLVTIVLTKPGTYVFDYDFVYNGYYTGPKPDMGFETEQIKLAIHGMSLMYSKEGFEGAKLQYFEIANHSTNNVSLIIPDGYRISSSLYGRENQKLGFVYDFVETGDDVREGNIITSKTIDSQINNKLNVADVDNVAKLIAQNNVTTSTIADYSNLTSSLSNLLTNVTYAETNQKSIWIDTSNDTYDLGDSVNPENNSFYVYSEQEIVPDDFYKEITSSEGTVVQIQNSVKPYTNTTTFKSKGYYLLFLNVIPNGINDSEYKYWQVFAFRHTSSSVDIQLETTDGSGNVKVVTNGKYSNNAVVISWQKPGVFDRAIKPYYYSVTNQNYSNDQMLTTFRNDLQVEEFIKEDDGVNKIYLKATLGYNVADETFVKYLVRLENEGDSVTHKSFTVDEQSISGIKSYLIQERISGGSYYYSIANDANGYPVQITNSITDSYATINWNNKASGAKTYATFDRTPFVTDSSDPSHRTAGSMNIGSYVTTNYTLGNTVVNDSFVKPSGESSISSDSVLFGEGIYTFHIWDDAGNETYYSIIIDRTENYFEIIDKNDNIQFVSNSSVLFGDDVKYFAGQYKAVKLANVTETLEPGLEKLLKCASSKNWQSYNKYYTGDNNISNLNNYIVADGDNYYLMVRNKIINIYEDNVPVGSTYDGLSTVGEIDYDKGALDGASSLRKTLYVSGENRTYTTNQGSADLSYVSIEINKDNARGYVYYSNSVINNLPTDGADFDDAETKNIVRLYTGNDAEGANGMNKAEATTASHVAFVWNIGEGAYTVSEVYYDFYTLKPNSFNTASPEKYFYELTSANIPLFKDGKYSNGAKSLGDGRAFVKFNGSSSSQEGLYVVTRKYASSSGLGDDSQVLNYYFIVDRNEIISTQIGGSIRIDLMENDKSFNNFSISGLVPKDLYHEDFKKEGDNSSVLAFEKYEVYLTTTKLPATLNIPVGKYFESASKTSAGYNSGKLNIQVYFNDVDNQLYDNDPNGLGVYDPNGEIKVRKIFDSEAIFTDANGVDRKFEYSVVNGVFVVDIFKYLSYVDNGVALQNRLTQSNKEWLFLPGEYVIRISDNVKGGEHEKLIGLKISSNKDVGPIVESFTGAKETGMAKTEDFNISRYEHTTTVSQEYLKVVLPAYNGDEIKKAQVDAMYIKVNCDTYGGTAFSYEYKAQGTTQLYPNPDGSVDIWLNTLLKKNGKIDVENLNKPITYTITVRYKLNNLDYSSYASSSSEDLQRYIDCYVYYDTTGKRIPYHTATYKIIIDRDAPNENIKDLNLQDSLVNDYNLAFNTDSMIETDYHETSSNVYFTKQYAKYYDEGSSDNQYIYAYNVYRDTPFKKTDVSKVLINHIVNLETYPLSLPAYEANYETVITNLTNIDTYGKLIHNNVTLNANSYYEIVEMDAAGNATQYVIHYEPSNAVLELPFTVKLSNNTTENVEFSLTDALDIVVLKIDGNGTSNNNNEYFFKIELLRSGENAPVWEKLTTPTTTFEDLAKEMAGVLANLKGQFKLNISTRDSTITHSLQIIDSGVALDFERFKQEIERSGLVVFNNLTVYQDGVHYYAPIIKVDGINYYGTIENGNAIYRNELGTIVPSLDCSSGTHTILITNLYEDVIPYIFNIEENYKAIDYKFVDKGTNYAYFSSQIEGNTAFYGYTNVGFTYDKHIYNGHVYVEKNGTYIDAVEYANDGYTYKREESEDFASLTLFASSDAGIRRFKIELVCESDTTYNVSYYFIIDNTMPYVSMRNNVGEDSKIINAQNNANYEEVPVSDTPGTGIMNLVWQELEENSYFDYEYLLYELKKGVSGQPDFYAEPIIFDGETTTGIVTKDDSTGIYKFVINVYVKGTRELAGNKVHAFEVQEVNTQVYYVRTRFADNTPGEAIEKENSYVFGEELGESNLGILNSAATSLGLSMISIDTKLPLYISNKTLEVVVTMPNVNKENVLSITEEDYILNVDAVFKKDKAFVVYIATMTVYPQAEDAPGLVKNVKVESLERTIEVQSSTSFTVSGKDNIVTIKADKIFEPVGLLNKNIMQLEVIYSVGDSSKLMEIVDFDFLNGYTIMGNGQYSFVFRDLAGNTHEYEDDGDDINLETVDTLDIYVLREVVLSVNGEAPIQNAFYNGEVSVAINASGRYVTGSVLLKAERNGVEYIPTGGNPYIFSDYGNYRVVVTAEYLDKTLDKTYQLEKVVTFTIINVEEARKTFDLTALSGHTIKSVINANNNNVTSAFIAMLNKNMATNGMNITYEDIINNAADLKVTAGKMKFTLTYVVDDGVYPEREVELAFTLNNETPTIPCTLKKGDSTTKSFTIYFNPAIIYEQIGEAYVYINNNVVAKIDMESPNQEVSIKTSFKHNGAGSYYIKLVSSSGVVLDSYKVVIKEPLNAWAIIVIVAVVAVVGTVVTTVIVLRRKMRIR